MKDRRALFVAVCGFGLLQSPLQSGDAADKLVESKLFNFAPLNTKFEEPKK
jgi:hypothetical protein